MKKNSTTIILLIIIIILAVLCILFATNKISFNKTEPAKETKDTTKETETSTTTSNESEATTKEKETYNEDEIYQKFLNSKEYLNDASSEAETINNLQYAYYDLNNDGIDELTIYTTDNGDFGTNYFYTIKDNKVTLIDKIYHYGKLTYNTDDNAIVYTEVRPSQAYGYAYGFYKLKDNKFELIKTLGVNIENGKESYYIDKQTITEEEYDKHFKNNINFNYKEVK